MDDTISRQAAIDTLDVGAELLKRVLDDADIVGAERKKYEWGLGLIEAYISDMKELPPAQTEQRWIPCSERLSEEGMEVLITKSVYALAPDKEECHCVEQAKYLGDDDWIVYSDEYGMPKPYQVIAWMPLPEPWRGEEK